MFSCFGFLQGRDDAGTPSPTSSFCGGLRTFFVDSGADETLLGCLCPVIHGQVNKSLPRRLDPAHLAFLPVACNIGLPPQILYEICHSEF
jgi:hypothetical protein